MTKPFTTEPHNFYEIGTFANTSGVKEMFNSGNPPSGFTKIFFDLCMSVASGGIATMEAVELTQNILFTAAAADGFDVCLFRAALADSVSFAELQFSDGKFNTMLSNLVTYVSAFKESREIFKHLLDEDMLDASGFVQGPVFFKRMKKLNTDRIYRQRKYNLCHEESEGYSKLACLLSARAPFTTKARYLRELIGKFDLDPNRVFDIALDLVEHGAGVQVEVDLNFFSECNPVTLSHIVGFKYTQCLARSWETPCSLSRMTAVLMSLKMLSLDKMLPYMAPGFSIMSALQSGIAKRACLITDSRRAFLPSSTVAASSGYRNGELLDVEKNGKSRNQVMCLLGALISDQLWCVATPLMDRLHRAGTLPVAYHVVRRALIKAAHYLVDPVYLQLKSTRCIPEIATSRSVPLSDLAVAVQNVPDPCDVPVDDSFERCSPRIQHQNYSALASLLHALEPLLCHLHVFLSVDVLLMLKICRLVTACFVSFRPASDLRRDIATSYKTSDALSSSSCSILGNILLPCLSLLAPNPALAMELWAALQHVPYRLRHSLYSGWRGAGLERNGRDAKHYEIMIAECRAGYDVRQILKRVANEKKHSKHVGRQLAKVAHSNPLVAFDVILSQIESYDNMIVPVVESLVFMTPLSLDVLAYMLRLHLSDSSRKKVQHDGISIAHWFLHLARFTGHFFRMFPSTEVRGLIDFIVHGLRRGEAIDLILFNELLARMGGCEMVEDMSNSQLLGLAGGEVLRRELLALEKPSKRAVNCLMEVLSDHGIARSLLSLLAQQHRHALFKEGFGYTKLLGEMHDKCQVVFVQLVEFLSHIMEGWYSPGYPGTGRRSIERPSYLSILPKLHYMCIHLKMSPQAALHAARPLMAAASELRRHSAEYASEVPCILVDELLNNWDPAGELLHEVQSVIPAHDWCYVTPRFFLRFWSLSLRDILVPTKIYESQISLLRSRRVSLQRFEANAPMVEKRKREISRCAQTAEALQAELQARNLHCTHVRNELQSENAHFFSVSQCSRLECVTDLLLRSCLIPRLLQTPEDALFCANFINLLHELETPHFPLIDFYERVVDEVFPILLSATDREARLLGIFFSATLTPFYKWYCNRELYDREAAPKPGFGHSAELVPSCPYERYRSVFTRWCSKMTAVVNQGLERWELSGRACLLVIIKLLGIYPVDAHTCAMLMSKLSALKSQETMKDVQAMANRYSQLLEQQRAFNIADPSYLFSPGDSNEFLAAVNC